MSKKYNFSFTPSKYQESFFEWVQHGVGNAVIEAKAGAAKTSTAVASMTLIPKKEKCLFIAFNKSIADELTKKLETESNCTVKTTHSLGFLIVKKNLGFNIEVDEYKYRNYLKKNISELCSDTEIFKNKKQADEYIENITQLINFSRYNLAQTEKEINKVADKYSIPVSFDECVVTQKCLEWGKNNYETVDYTDMLWLPVELSLPTKNLIYDWVYIDEGQDLSLCSAQLFLKCLKRGGRFVFIGDPDQTINLFAGSSESVFEDMKNYPNTTTFNLPVSYRCGKKIIEFTNKIVQNIFSAENAIEGEVLNNCSIKMLKDGDMVLGRSKTPIIKLYTKLLSKNINCYIKGQDIGRNLINILNTFKQEKLNSNLEDDGLFVQLYDKLFNERNNLIRTRGLDFKDATLSSFIMEKYDNIQTLSLLTKGCKTKTELKDKIENIFKENSDGICLSTIHKSKGLEADNVYILCHSSMPSKLVKHNWEKLQEKNLIYVAYTRAKKRLGFISEKEIKPSGSSMDEDEILNDLIKIELKVCKLLKKEPMKQVENTEVLKIKLNHRTKIVDIHDNDNTVNITKTAINEEGLDLLSELDALC